MSRPNLTSGLFTHTHTHTHTHTSTWFRCPGFHLKIRICIPTSNIFPDSRSTRHTTLTHFNNHLQGSFCSQDNSQSLSGAFRLAAIYSPVYLPWLPLLDPLPWAGASLLPEQGKPCLTLCLCFCLSSSPQRLLLCCLLSERLPALGRPLTSRMLFQQNLAYGDLSLL